MKTLRITDIEGNLVVRTEIDTSNDNFSWTPRSGSCIVLGGVSLTENYTVAEAKMAAQESAMDIYHKELILWLCDEVDKHASQILKFTTNNIGGRNDNKRNSQ